MQNVNFGSSAHYEEPQERGFKLMGAVERHKTGKIADAELNSSASDDDQFFEDDADRTSWFSVLKQRAQGQDNG